jgi:hypothetical protein
MSAKKLMSAGLALAFVFLALQTAARAAVIVVDGKPGSPSLAEAIDEANASPEPDRIVVDGTHFPDAVLPPIGNKVTIVGEQDAVVDGNLLLPSVVTPSGALLGPAGLEIAGSDVKVLDLHLRNWLIGVRANAGPSERFKKVVVSGCRFTGTMYSAVSFEATGDGVLRGEIIGNDVLGAEIDPVSLSSEEQATEGIRAIVGTLDVDPGLTPEGADLDVTISNNRVRNLRPRVDPFLGDFSPQGIVVGVFSNGATDNLVRGLVVGNRVENVGAFVPDPAMLGTGVLIAGGGFDFSQFFGPGGGDNSVEVVVQDNKVESAPTPFQVAGSLSASRNEARAWIIGNEATGGGALTIFGGLPVAGAPANDNDVEVQAFDNQIEAGPFFSGDPGVFFLGGFGGPFDGGNRIEAEIRDLRLSGFGTEVGIIDKAGPPDNAPDNEILVEAEDIESDAAFPFFILDNVPGGLIYIKDAVQLFP